MFKVTVKKRSKVVMHAIFLLLLVSFAIKGTLSQNYYDFEVRCPPRERVTSISRAQGNGVKPGTFSVTCGPFQTRIGFPLCRWEDPFGCTGTGSKEPCTDNRWLAGLRGFELDTTTGVLL